MITFLLTGIMSLSCPQIVELSCPQLDYVVSQESKQQALQCREEVYQELANGSYDAHAAKTIAQFCTDLVDNHLAAGAKAASQEVEQFKNEINNTLTVTPRSEDERGHNPSWLLSKNNTPLAILKKSLEIKMPPEILLSHPLCFSSFLKHVPDMPLTTTVTDFEVMGYEMDALFGFRRTPVTLKATFSDNSVGIVQKFVANGEPIGNFIYLENRGQELGALPVATVHLACLSGIFKGVGAHHIGNYLITGNDIVEIDLEEIMPPYNKVPGLSIVLCRLVLLGLPQAKKPLDKAMLMTICHPSFQALLQGYHDKLLQEKRILPACLAAQKERLDRMQELCKNALKNNTKLNMRDIYFDIFGGYDLYRLAKAHGYPDITAFNNVISDPYNDVIKDFSNPVISKPSTSLEPIQATDKPEDKVRKANLQALEKFY